MPPDEFDWSLGEPVDDTGDVGITPVSERGARLASPNDLDVQSQAPSEEHHGDADDGAASDDAAVPVDADAAGGGVADDGQDAQGDDGSGADGLILGKFKSQEELVRAYTEAEQRLGQQGNEVGQLRREMDEMRGSMQAMNAPQQAQITDDLVSQVDELAMSNPQGAAVWALENQPLLYNRVMQIWAGNDALGASRFENAMMREQLKQEMDEKMQAQYGPVASTVHENTQATQFDSAWRSVSSKFPDFKTFESGLIDAASAAPELASALQSGDVASKERLIENLYWLAKGRQADTIAAAATDLGRTEQQQAATDKRKSSVASGSATQARGDKSNVETWKESFLAAPSTSIVDGLREAVKR